MFVFVERETREIVGIDTVPEGRTKGEFDVYQVDEVPADMDGPGWYYIDHEITTEALVCDDEDQVDDDDAEPEDTSDIEADHDLSVLDLSIGKLTDALQDIDDVMYLLTLLEAEHDGKTRKGALAAINDRLCELGVED